MSNLERLSLPPLWTGWSSLPHVAAQLPYYELFWARVNIVWDDDSCWEWTGATDADGYGVLQHRGVHWRAAPAAWTLTRGPIPPGQHILHSCDNPPCCRPAVGSFGGHLRPGTPAENHEDRIRRHRNATLQRARLEAMGQLSLPL